MKDIYFIFYSGHPTTDKAIKFKVNGSVESGTSLTDLTLHDAEVVGDCHLPIGTLVISVDDEANVFELSDIARMHSYKDDVLDNTDFMYRGCSDNIVVIEQIKANTFTINVNEPNPDNAVDLSSVV